MAKINYKNIQEIYAYIIKSIDKTSDLKIKSS